MGERDVEGTDATAAIVADATIVGNVVANRCSVALGFRRECHVPPYEGARVRFYGKNATRSSVKARKLGLHEGAHRTPCCARRLDALGGRAAREKPW
jgi:hypothetical protein